MTDQVLIALQPINLGLADLLDQLWPVPSNVAAQDVVTGAARLVHVPEVEPQVCRRPYTAEVRAMPLPIPTGWLVTANAAEMRVTGRYLPSSTEVYRARLRWPDHPAIHAALVAAPEQPHKLQIPLGTGQLRHHRLGILCDQGDRLSRGYTNRAAYITQRESHWIATLAAVETGFNTVRPAGADLAQVPLPLIEMA